jgi:hypothetical protein
MGKITLVQQLQQLATAIGLIDKKFETLTRLKDEEAVNGIAFTAGTKFAAVVHASYFFRVIPFPSPENLQQRVFQKRS